MKCVGVQVSGQLSTETRVNHLPHCNRLQIKHQDLIVHACYFLYFGTSLYMKQHDGSACNFQTCPSHQHFRFSIAVITDCLFVCLHDRSLTFLSFLTSMVHNAEWHTNTSVNVQRTGFNYGLKEDATLLTHWVCLLISLHAKCLCFFYRERILLSAE